MRSSYISLLLCIPFISFSQCDDGQHLITLTTTTGDYAYESGWSLYSIGGWQTGDALAEFEGEENFETTSIELCIDTEECYIIHATDDFEDGWEDGYLEVETFGVSETFEMEDGANAYWQFEIETGPCKFEISGCTDASAPNYNDQATVDDGSCVELLTYDYGKTIRKYIFYKPSNLSPGAPLVFVFHGYAGSPDEIMNYSKMNEVAEDNGFAVCYPQGTKDNDNNRFFNVGYTFQNNPTVDDLGFVVSLAQHLQEAHALSAVNTFSTGMSNGGDFSYMLACQASNTFRAVAPISGMILEDIYNDCDAANPVPVFEIHGTEDDVTYYEGDMSNQGGWGAYLDIPSTIDYFVDKINLEDLAIDTLTNIDANDGSIVVSYVYSSENTSDEVWLYKVINGGHDWPGAWGNMDIDASQKAWEFFNKMLATESTAIQANKANDNKKLLKITNVLGQETAAKFNIPLLYIYNDGTVEKRLIFKK